MKRKLTREATVLVITTRSLMISDVRAHSYSNAMLGKEKLQMAITQDHSRAKVA